MLTMLRNRRDEEGFTLIELMVVVLIIAILIAIAIPTFLGARERAQERAAQSSSRNALTAAKTLYSDDGNYSSANDTAIEAVAPELTYVATGTVSNDAKTVSVFNDADSWAAAVRSADGTCFLLRDEATGTAGTFFGQTEVAASCTGTFASTPANTTLAEW